jgi:hypothetical protein
MLWYAAHINKLALHASPFAPLRRGLRGRSSGPEIRRTKSRTVKRDDSIDLTYRFAVR